MAGRPATVRGGGLTSLHLGLIVFAFISVAALGGFVFMLTRVKEVDARSAGLQRRLDTYGTPPAPVGTYFETEARNRNTTVFAALAGDRGRLASLIAGTEEAIAPTLETEVNTLLGQIAAGKPGVVNANDTLLTAVRKLDERLTEEQGKLTEARAALADRERQVQALTQQLKAARDTYEQQAAEFDTRLNQAREDAARQLTDKDTQLSEVQGTLEVREQQLQQLKREGDQEKRAMQADINRQQRQIGDLQKSIQDLKGSFDPEAILRKADGRILRAIPGSDVVYINLGARDNIKPGMSFEVYSQTGASEKTLRGKASIEIGTVMEDTSECRVTRTTPGQPIVEGDVVVNIAYEQNRKPKFVVRGDFDLNYDGQIDFAGADQVASLIRQWGGQVVPELDESVDYVVIGTAPRTPDLPAGASDVVRDQADRRMLELSEFRKLIDQARSMYIPVITQNQFLFLTGYAGSGVVRGR